MLGRLLWLGVVALLLAGCDVLLGPDKSVGQPLPDGSLVVNRGTLDGAEWMATAVRRGDEICIEYSGTRQPVSGICNAFGRAGGIGMSAGHGEFLSQVEGFVDRGGLVRVETSRGTAELHPVSLQALGAPASAYAMLLPRGTDLVRVVVLDSNGVMIDEMDLRQPVPGPP